MKRLALALLLGSALVGPSLAVVSSTPVGNVSYTLLLSDQRILFSVAFTAPRTLTLISAGASCIGQTCGANSLEIIDQIGAVTATNTLTITPASGETINNSTSSVVIAEPFMRVLLIPTSGSNWHLVLYAPGQFPGTTTNDAAPVGSLGEYVYSLTGNAIQANTTLPNGTGAGSVITSAPVLVTTVGANITQALLSAGDWDCRGDVTLGTVGAGTSTAATVFAAWTSTTNQSTLPTFNQTATPQNPSWVGIQAASVSSPLWSLSVPPARYSLAASTSVFLNAVATFSAGTPTGIGSLACRRVR